MCPLCIATGTLVLAGAGSAGGLGALAARILHTRREVSRVSTSSATRQLCYGPSSGTAAKGCRVGVQNE